MYPETESESSIVDLYGMQSEDGEKKIVPFQHVIELHGPRGEIARWMSTFDDGAMVDAIDLKEFGKVKHRLAALKQSNRVLRMADGRLVPSTGVWNGILKVANVPREGTFEVFDSNGAWSVLFGKPSLKRFKAIHDYDVDTVTIRDGDNRIEIKNQHCQGDRMTWWQLTHQGSNTKQRTNSKGDYSASPSRQVSQCTINRSNRLNENVMAGNAKQGEHQDWPADQESNTKQCINFTGDQRTTPLRRVSQTNHNTKDPNGNTEVAHLGRERNGNQPRQEPEPQTVLTQQGKPRHTKEERIKWRTDNGMNPKKT
jgi:hypothetical protein